MDTASSRLLDAWQQCQRHAHHLLHALAAIEPSLPLSAPALNALSDEAVQDWDQFVLRFTKLQDTIGARLFPAPKTPKPHEVDVSVFVLKGGAPGKHNFIYRRVKRCKNQKFFL